MTDSIIFYPELPGADYLKDMQVEGRIRVALNPLRSLHAGIALHASESTETLSLVAAPSCPPNLPPCDPYELVNYLRSRISAMEPLKFVAFVPVTVAPGARRKWESDVQEVERANDREGTFLAAAHLLGRGPYNGMVEVMADDLRVMLDLLLAVTDFDYVSRADVHLVHPDSQLGMGSETFSSPG